LVKDDIFFKTKEACQRSKPQRYTMIKNKIKKIQKRTGTNNQKVKVLKKKNQKVKDTMY